MSKIRNGGHAFPTGNFKCDEDGNTTPYDEDGMTLRDYFAAKAMAGWLASYAPDAQHPASRGKAGDLAEMAYDMADAMLRAREVNE